MLDHGYGDFFDDIWGDMPPLYADIDGQSVRVIEALPKVEYANERGISLPSGTRTLSFVAAELPPSWRPVPGASLTLRDRAYLVHQDMPPEPLCPDGSIVRLTVHPV